MHGLNLLIIAIGVFLGALAYAEDENLDEDGFPPKGVVIVEPTDVLFAPAEDHETEKLRPYLERRGRWGSMWSVGYSTYEPVNYAPEQAGVLTTGEQPAFGDVFNRPATPLVELQIDVKRNLDFGSLGGELAFGTYMTYAQGNDISDTLSVMPLRLGAVFTLDNLFSEPYVVPYASVGAYMMMWKEDGAENVSSGTTKVAPYFLVGAQFALDWIDHVSARDAWLSSGLNGTFLFAEARKFVASSNGDDPDLSNTISYGGGLRLEF